MATRQFYATRDFKYGTRMLRAGDAVEMAAPHARLYTALNAISTAKPKAKAEAVEETVTEEVVKAPAKRTRRRAAKK